MDHDKGIINRSNQPNLFWHCLLNIKTYIWAILVVGLLAIGYTTAHYGYIQGLALGLLPIGLYLALIGLQKPKATFYAFFVLNYFLMGIGRYSMGSDFPFGTLIDATIVYIFLVLLVQSILTKNYFQWGNINNIFTYLSLAWLLYCFSELFNPLCLSTEAWSSSIRGIAFYMFAVACVAPVVLNKFKDLKILMFIWSLLTVIAVCKAMMQKFVGFDFAESYWLFVLGGQLTHIIGYGVRYFSFFTDAANFGAGMAMSMTVFSIYALFVKGKLRIWYLLVTLLAFYGMLLSGTRAALAIPFVGYVLLVLLSKKAKLILSVSIIILLSFSFLKYTHMGEGNALIRRMRSALDANDPSMVVRYQNQAKFKTYMVDKPFGVGLGLAGVKAKRYTPDAYLASIPTDSWYIMLWIETGIVGLLINLLVMFSVIGYGCYQVLFRIRSNLLKGINIALIAGCSGMMVASYVNEILGQFPNGIIIYTSMAMIMMSPQFDKELSEAENHEQQ